MLEACQKENERWKGKCPYDKKLATCSRIKAIEEEEANSNNTMYG